MPKYEDLTTNQRKLYDQLKDEIRKEKDISPTLQEFGESDFLPILTATDKGDFTLLGDSILSLVQLKSLLTVLKEKLVLGELINQVLNVKICFTASQGEKKYISLIESTTDCDIDPDHQALLVFLYAIKEVCSLETFMFTIGKDNSMKIKEKLEPIQGKDEIYRSALKCISDIYEKNTLGMGNESKPVGKAIVAGAIGGVIAGLAVGGGCFVAGIALPMLALIGIAVAAALVTGLAAGGITYVISSKIESPDTSSLATEQGLPQLN